MEGSKTISNCTWTLISILHEQVGRLKRTRKRAGGEIEKKQEKGKVMSIYSRVHVTFTKFLHHWIFTGCFYQNLEALLETTEILFNIPLWVEPTL